MPFNGSGGFIALTSPDFPAVSGEIIYASRFNNVINDLINGLSNTICRDGQSTITANIPMSGFKFTGLGDGTATGQALVYGQATAASLGALTLTGAFAANGGVTLGDASGDSLTINSNTASIPNGLSLTGGNVGIGGTPTSRLDVMGPNSVTARIRSTGADEASLLLQNSASGATDGSGLMLRMATDGVTSYVWNYENGALLLGTNSTERVRVDASGNVLVGTTSATEKFVVSQGNAYLLRTGGAKLRLADQLNEISLESVPTGGSSDAIIKTGSAERLRIDSSGNLLVGTTNQTWGLAGRGLVEINGSSTALMGLKIGGNAKGYLYHDGTNLELANVNATGGLRFVVTAGTLAASFDSSGHFILAANKQLREAGGEILAAKDASGFFFANGGGVNPAVPVFLGNTGTTQLDLNAGTGFARVIAGSAERVRVDSAGRVGIGIGTSLAAQLSLFGRQELGRLIDDAAFISFYNTANSTRTGYLQMQAAGASSLMIEAAQSLVLGTSGTARLNITSGGLFGFGITPTNFIDAQINSSLTAKFRANSASGTASVWLSAGDGTTSNRNAYFRAESNETSPQEWLMGMIGDKNFAIYDSIAARIGLGVDTAGRVYGHALHNNASSPTGTTNQYIASGTYTPTLTGVTNITSTTSRSCQWLRVGNVVTVSGSFAVQATASGTKSVRISLPIASALTQVWQCSGTGEEDQTSGSFGGPIKGDATNDAALYATAASLAGVTVECHFSFTYLVL